MKWLAEKARGLWARQERPTAMDCFVLTAMLIIVALTAFASLGKASDKKTSHHVTGSRSTRS
jgi:hypothetical protein